MQNEAKIKKDVIKFLKRHRGRYFKQKKIAQALNIPNSLYRDFKSLLQALSRAGKIERGRKSRYRISDPSKVLQGRISFSSKGFAFVTTEDGKEIFIDAFEAGTAFHKDWVAVQKYRRQRGPRPEGKVTKVLQRSQEPIFGTVKRKPQGWVTIPESPSPPVNIYITGDTQQLEEGQIVELADLEWHHPKEMPRARVTDIIGRPEDPQNDLTLVKKMFQLEAGFSKGVKNATQPLQLPDIKKELPRRVDLRDKTIFTIDPETAKDFDDAVSLEKKGNNWILGVHIADVSYFVKPKSTIDKSARDRGTSVYLGNAVIPMLPERLSNELCSLQPDKERLTLSIFMELDHQAAVKNYQIQPGVIKSKKRFSYEEAQQILDQGSGPLHAELSAMRTLSRLLFEKRSAAGSIDFDIPEPVFEISDAGIPYEMKPSERLDTHRLIEEFMLLANRTVAEWIAIDRKKEKLPFLYRVHEAPDEESVKGLYHLLTRLGMSYARPKRFTPNHLRKILEDVEELPFKNFIEQISLRSMEKAIYTTQRQGHFGLAFKHYTHFTSPIRRYPDLMVHRLIKLYRHRYRYEDIDFYRRFLPKVAEQSTQAEINAMEAEREFIKLKQIRFIAGKIGEWYKGVITGVMEFGFFVELSEYLVEGLVHVRTLQDDYYVYDQENHLMKGRRHGRVFRLGDVVNVKVKEVSIKERRIDFIWGE